MGASRFFAASLVYDGSCKFRRDLNFLFRLVTDRLLTVFPASLVLTKLVGTDFKSLLEMFCRDWPSSV